MEDMTLLIKDINNQYCTIRMTEFLEQARLNSIKVFGMDLQTINKLRMENRKLKEGIIPYDIIKKLNKKE